MFVFSDVASLMWHQECHIIAIAVKGFKAGAIAAPAA